MDWENTKQLRSVPVHWLVVRLKCENTTTSDGFFLLLVMHLLKHAVKMLARDSIHVFQTSELTLKMQQQWRLVRQEEKIRSIHAFFPPLLTNLTACHEIAGITHSEHVAFQGCLKYLSVCRIVKCFEN